MKAASVYLAPLIFLLTACSPAYYINRTVSDYEAVADRVQLGDPKEKVIALLEPTQKDLDSSWRKKPEKYTKNDVLVEIYFARSGLQEDGLTTDDEFTPYVFNNGKLVAIGWTAIGGARSQGQARSNTTVNVQQQTIVY
jgi:hypothetical protein